MRAVSVAAPVRAVHYFGPPWNFDYLALPGQRLVPRDPPVGETCLWCDEEIAAGDRGVLRAIFAGDPPRAASAPLHAECEIREREGSPAHLVGRCACRGFTEPQRPGTLREEALATVELINAKRAWIGLDPLW